MNIKIGHGYDVHQLVSGRKLILGGVEITHDKGLLGHSDADVVLHAICDAILGALALGDIGQHFPDTDPKYEGIDSRHLLQQITALMSSKNYKMCNLDVTIVAQAPKLSNHLSLMRENIASDLKSTIDQINIKATTTEKLGFVGRQEGIEAHAVILLQYDDN